MALNLNLNKAINAINNAIKSIMLFVLTVAIRKNTAKLRIMPTTEAVIAISCTLNLILSRVDSITGAPIKINKKDGKKVKNVATNVLIDPEIIPIWVLNNS